MLLQFVEFVLSFLALILVLDARYQRTLFYDKGDSVSFPALCHRDSYCVDIMQCRTLRHSPNLWNVGVTCGCGKGIFRQVCCPSRIDTISKSAIKSSAVQSYKPSRQTASTIVRPKPRRANVLWTSHIDYAECGQPKISRVMGTIMGGQNATEGEWPWMAAITKRTSSKKYYTPFCSGFLIDKRHILSAAHCFKSKKAEFYQARIGSVDQNRAEMFTIAKITVPRKYEQGFYYNDIAILTLTRDVTLRNFTPICLPDELIIRMNLTGKESTVAGWGADKPRGKMSSVLRQLRHMPIVPNIDCNRAYLKKDPNFCKIFWKGIDSGFLCAGFPKGGKDSCWGDSGGPLMLRKRNRWFAVGIISFGYSCGLPGVPGGYTRITEYLDWIRQNTQY